MTRPALLPLLLSALALSCAPGDAARGRAEGLVAGVVVDPLSGAALAGVRVRTHDVRASTVTDRGGRFALRLRPGDHHLWLDRAGYVDGERAGVAVRAGRTTELEVRLFPRAPTDASIDAYFARQPPRRHAHPAHERPAPPAAEGEVGAVRAAIHEPPSLPATIRVWRSSRAGALAPSRANGWADNSCDPSAQVEELPLEEYVRGVVPHEWIPSWHAESLRAGAIAARTYAASWAIRGGRWACADVDDGTVTQVYRDERAATTDEAILATAGIVVMRDEAVISTEYSAENATPTAFGVDDPTCAGEALFGHGRGMCQWGTQRWANGICANPPCDFGAFGATPRDHVWMVEHYYPGATTVGGTAAPIPPCRVIGPEGGILDDAGPCFTPFGPSTYWRIVADAGWDGGLVWTNAFQAASPSNWGRWRIELSDPGRFTVEVYIEPGYGVYAETRYEVSHAGGDDTVIVDQGASSGWVPLGTYDFDATGEVRVYDNYAGVIPADQKIVADAIRLTPEGGAPPDGGGPDGGAPGAGAYQVGRPVVTGARLTTGCAAAPRPGAALAGWALGLALLALRRRRR